MELRICPGLTRLYRLALVETDDSFTVLSEHDTPAQAIKARAAARQAADDAVASLRSIAA